MIRVSAPEIDDVELLAVQKVLRSGFLVQGENVQRFENVVADYVSAKHAIAVSSGTAALHLAMMALGIGNGDEVIIPDFTFPATANVVKLVGAEPVFVDINIETFNIDTNLILPAITKRTKAIMPVHLFGQATNMGEIRHIADEHNLKIVEDAACALGTEFEGRRVGAIGDIGCISFHPRKVVTTGEGGMIVTNHDAMATQLRLLRNHGLNQVNGQWQFDLAGFNYRLTDFQGALGLAQMQKLESILAKRREIARLYSELLSDEHELQLPLELSNSRHSWQSFVILVADHIDRNSLIRTLRSVGIESTIGTYSTSKQPYYFRRDADRFPRSFHAYSKGLSLPIHTRLSSSDIETVVEAVKNAIKAPQ